MNWVVVLGALAYLVGVLAVNWWLARRDSRRGDRIATEIYRWLDAEAYRRARPEHPDSKT